MKGNQRFFIGLLIGALVGGGFSYLFLNKKYKAQTNFHQIQIEQQAALIEATRDSGQMKLMSNLLDKIDDELQANPKRVLSDETIDRIEALSYTFQSHSYIEGDSASIKNRNPARGRLLLTLSKLNLDSNTLQKVLTRTSFAGAAIREADLKGANLSGADLRGADLQGANLQNSNLSGANLKGANLWGAKLDSAKMNGIDLTRAELSWAELNGVDLRKAILHEANLVSAQLRKADMRYSVLQWVDFTGAFLNEANLDSADMFRAMLKRANLEKAVLTNTNLKFANITEANLTNVNLTNAEVIDLFNTDPNWLTRLNEWPVTGAKEIQSQYSLRHEKSQGEMIYLLKKTSN